MTTLRNAAGLIALLAALAPSLMAQWPSSNARRAARTAWSTSALTADGTAPTISSVAGLIIVITSGDAELTRRPPA